MSQWIRFLTNEYYSSLNDLRWSSSNYPMVHLSLDLIRDEPLSYLTKIKLVFFLIKRKMKIILNNILKIYNKKKQ